MRRRGRDSGFGIGIGDLGLWRVGVSVLGYGLRARYYMLHIEDWGLEIEKWILGRVN